MELRQQKKRPEGLFFVLLSNQDVATQRLDVFQTVPEEQFCVSNISISGSISDFCIVVCDGCGLDRLNLVARCVIEQSQNAVSNQAGIVSNVNL